MRFNPPPNWPQPPAGWSPPPGWEPDASWPRPPSGWQLWVEDDTFVISPDPDPAPRTRSAPRAGATAWQTGGSATAWQPAQARAQAGAAQPWHRRTVSVVLFLIFFFPVGVVLLWMRQDWSVRRRGLVTAAVGIFVIFALASQGSQPPTTTTALNPKTVVTASSSSAPASSRPAAPAPSASSPSATPSRTPATSAAPHTSAAAPVHTTAAPVRHTSAAPVHTTAAPVHTTKAPQPVKTTTSKPSCYPRAASSGNCYTPGEFCSKAEHNTSGIDASGDPITCKQDGSYWRWEKG